jgi:microsomal dipeptidase-like Zn-dependent dipeptidase
MIDLHQDLLSILYYGYLRNDFSYVEKWISNFHGDNVSGLLANLYFMNPEEMKKEIGDCEISVVEMFSKATELFHKYLPNEDVIFSIEGCDYIKDEDELEELFKLGLRNILLVWNNPNKYGSGNRGDYGLTDEGKSFLRKAIELGISIDLSHMNKKTFYDTIELIKDEQNLGKEVKVIASHSNCFEVCPHMRNLDDSQLLALKSVGGLLGLVSYSFFVTDKEEDLKEVYLKHIEHAVSIMGIDKVGVSSDDMTFSKVLFGEDYGRMVFDYSTISSDLKSLLLTKYSLEDVDKIMYKNIYNKLFN